MSETLCKDFDAWPLLFDWAHWKWKRSFGVQPIPVAPGGKCAELLGCNCIVKVYKVQLDGRPPFSHPMTFIMPNCPIHGKPEPFQLN